MQLASINANNPNDCVLYVYFVACVWCGPRHLVVCVELLVLPLALPEGLSLGLQGLGQVSVLQALL